MKKSINLFMTLTSLILCACSTNDLVDANSIENPISNIDTSTGILSFSTKEDFENALENYNEGNTSITRGVRISILQRNFMITLFKMMRELKRLVS